MQTLLSFMEDLAESHSVASPQYYIDNREAVKAKARAYYAANKERIAATKREQGNRYYHSRKGTQEFKIKQLYDGARERSRKSELPFDLDVEYIKSLWESTNGCCSVSGTPFDLKPSETFQNPNAASLDKIIPKLGYVKGNVRLVTWHVNAAILNFGLPTFLTLCENVIKHNKEQNGS